MQIDTVFYLVTKKNLKRFYVCLCSLSKLNKLKYILSFLKRDMFVRIFSEITTNIKARTSATAYVTFYLLLYTDKRLLSIDFRK